MNFFEAQAQARRHTVRLVVLFALAVVGLVALANLVVLVVMAYGRTGMFNLSPVFLAQQFDWAVFFWVTFFIVGLVALGSVFKTVALARGGGRAVAEMLGGRLVPGGTRDFHERRLMNVVEEMAIASGIPVPPVYVLDEPGINAFAAGATPNTAVIGVTRGALELLDRDELQGVIAHEFGHVFNGDMRLNLRLMGVLHGILLLMLMGYYMLRSMRYARASRGRGGTGAAAAIPLIGLGLMAIGSIGYFFGQWIKATISRQRELLADATAVQYTRDRAGLAGALRKIGGLAQGSRLETPAAAQYSHALFARGIGGALQSLFATHPPLDERIRRIDPQWDGRFVSPAPAASVAGSGEGERAAREDERRAATAAAAVTGAVAAGILGVDALIGRAGTANAEQLGRAREILETIPPRLRSAAEEPYGARAVVYGLLMAEGEEVAEAQERVLSARADPNVVLLTRALKDDLRALPDPVGLPLVELAMPALASLSSDQYRRFRDVIGELIMADRRVDFREWILRRFLLGQLDIHFGLRRPARVRYGELAPVAGEIAFALSIFAHIAQADDAGAHTAFDRGVSALGEDALQLRFLARDELSLRGLDGAVDRLEALDPLLKERVLKAFAACILSDGEPTTRSLELLRTLASALDIPLGPLGVGPW